MTFYIKTYGCQMNVNDSEKMRHILESRGMVHAETPDTADLVIINSCAVREKARDKIYSYIGRLTPDKKIIVAGCVAQVEREEILKRCPGVDFILGTHQFFRIDQAIDLILNEKEREVFAGFSRQWNELCPDMNSRVSRVSGYISIMEGCDNFCSYCIVPFTRGREKYRPFKNIMDEAKYLSDSGYREIILLGQNVNGWKDTVKNCGFADLLKALAEETRVKWIRFITSYPGYFTGDMIRVMARFDNIARHIHFPAQSGSTRILKKMNRSYSRKEYLDIIKRFKKEIPDIKFSSDFIVGFPGETERDFALTLSLIEDVEYESLFSFIYSPRPHTRLFSVPDTVGDGIKKERLARLQNLQQEIQLKNNKKYIGKTVEVLVTQRNSKKPDEVIGRTESYRVVNFVSRASAGEFKKVLIGRVGPHSLRGLENDGRVQPSDIS
jgi:tRNA-2-methylthio-N6-dimethylallyladenosine synthase